MSTIVDVCKLAGVSKATVSRVINGTGQVKESTRDSVYAAMDRLGYRPNKLAQALATNKTNSIGLVVSNFEGAYFGSLLKQAAASAESAHKQLIVTDGHNNAEGEYEAIRQLEGRCDAIVLYSRTMSDEHIKTLYQQLTVPFIVMNRTFPDSFAHTVTFDQEGAVSTMMDHLISYGHRQIACITGSLDNPTGRARLAGYKKVLKRCGIPFKPNLVESGDYHIKSGYSACKELLNHEVSFTAVIAFNDCMALGAIKALTEVGIKVPCQVSIAGIDNDPIAEFFSPALTTIELPIDAMTQQAMELAIELCIKPKSSSAHQHKVTLIQRESVIPRQATKEWLAF